MLGAVSAFVRPRFETAVNNADKASREAALNAIENDLIAALEPKYPDRGKEIRGFFEKELKAFVRTQILEKGIRPDGRGLKDIRPIWCETGVLPRTHGSAIFTRGQTQVLSVVTLGSPGEEQRLDGLGGRGPSATSTTTTSRRSALARHAHRVARVGARSAMVRWPSARCSR